MASLSLSEPGGALQVGMTLTLVADVRDASGAAITGRSAAWSTSDAAVATVANGLVTGVAPGSATITAVVDDKSATKQVTVVRSAVAAVSITPLGTTPVAGTTTPLVVVLKASDSTVLSGRPITFTSSQPLVAKVNATAQLVATSPGTTTLTATSEGVSATLSVDVVAPAGSVAPTIASISPASLAPGSTATIDGTGFLAPSSNAVTIGGVAAAVVAASPTSLTIVVPAAGLPCQSAQNTTVAVATVGGMATVSHPLVVATPRTLAVGESFVTDASGPIACNELPAGGSYIVTVFNGATSATATARFDLRGSAGASTARAPAAQPVAAVAPILTDAPSAGSPAQRAHIARLDEDRALLDRLGAPRRVAHRAGPSFSRSSSVPVPLFVGSTTTIKYHYASCTAGATTSITARVVYVGPHSVVLEDVASALAGKLDADLIALADQFENVSYPLLLNFGNPLAYDAQTDGNGHLVILFTPRVNASSANLLGFVSACDLYPVQTDPAVAGSNEGEIFYARTVTDTSSTSTSLDGRPEWRRQMPATMIHEAKHIVSYAERLARGATVFEQTWLEEGTAQIASELFGRTLHGNGWRGDAGFTPSLWCEAQPATAGCAGGALVMTSHFTFLTNYFRLFQSKSILSGSEDSDIYGSAWLFARWLTDTYGGADEGAFLRSLVQTSTLSGTANVEAASGKKFSQLLAEFSLMVAADNLPNVAGPYVEPSWNLPDVFVGLSDVGSQPPAPLSLRQNSGGTFAVTNRSLKGGGAVLVRIDGGSSGATQLLDLRASLSTPLTSASTIGLGVLRIQ
ncbi:MAG: Ig-like domain-containing protein [Gemmatimonadetes bacterium]|nr:Ig-like domain-containing protein [Gemmatimonadota bacterium]